MLNKIISFVREAGDFAKAQQTSVNLFDSKLKSDLFSDVVTTTDLEISRRFKAFIEVEFADLDYLVIDEETISELAPSPLAEAKKHEYVFSIDPIDGTLTYSVGLPFYGVSVGVFHNQKPLISAIYLPGLDVFIYGDRRGIFVERSGQKTAVTANSRPAPLQINKAFFKVDPMQLRKMNLSYLNPYAASVSSVYLALGQVMVWTFAASFWDITGACLLFDKLNLQIFNPRTDQPVDLFDEKLFSAKLRIQEPTIVCAPKFYQDFKKLYKL